MAYLILAVLLAVGCAGRQIIQDADGNRLVIENTKPGPLSFLVPKPKVFNTWTFPGLARDGGTLTINEGNHAHIEETCMDGGEHDDGRKVNFANKPIACTDAEGSVIDYLRGKACVIAHELCHVAGIPNIICGKAYNVEKYCK